MRKRTEKGAEEKGSRKLGKKNPAGDKYDHSAFGRGTY